MLEQNISNGNIHGNSELNQNPTDEHLETSDQKSISRFSRSPALQHKLQHESINKDGRASMTSDNSKYEYMTNVKFRTKS